MSYLIATGILPGMEAAPKTTRTSVSHPGRPDNVTRSFDNAMDHLEKYYFGASRKYFSRNFEPCFLIPMAVFDRNMNAIFGGEQIGRLGNGLKNAGL